MANEESQLADQTRKALAKVPPPNIFSGWKAIANYLRMGVRTAQRYEREHALPIHRPNGKSAGAVIATKAELDDWIRGSLTRKPKQWPGARTQRLGAEFLQVDSNMALTFSNIALTTHDKQKKIRMTQVARNAYDTIKRLRLFATLSGPQNDRLDANLRRLESELQMLGEAF